MKAKTYKYTKSDIARAAGLSEGKVRKDSRTGAFDAGSLRSTAAYVALGLLRGVGIGKAPRS